MFPFLSLQDSSQASTNDSVLITSYVHTSSSRDITLADPFIPDLQSSLKSSSNLVHNICSEVFTSLTFTELQYFLDSLKDLESSSLIVQGSSFQNDKSSVGAPLVNVSWANSAISIVAKTKLCILILSSDSKSQSDSIKKFVKSVGL
jgi:hypothetical protein